VLRRRGKDGKRRELDVLTGREAIPWRTKADKKKEKKFGKGPTEVKGSVLEIRPGLSH